MRSTIKAHAEAEAELEAATSFHRGEGRSQEAAAAKAELRELERAPKVKVRRRAADFMVGLTPAGLPAAAGFAPRSLYNSTVEKPPSERFVNGKSVSNDGRSSNELSDLFGTASPYPSSSILVVS